MRWMYLMLLAVLPVSSWAQSCPDLLNHEFRRLGSEERVRLCDEYAGKVILVVNTASKCAFTPQYDGLEKLYDERKNEGLVVLGFPSNDFANQEPGTEKQIQDFCRLTYSVQFPMFEKISVSEGRADPFFQQLASLSGGYPRWNFYKYLIGRDGQLVDSFSSFTGPESSKLLAAVDEALAR